MDLVSYSNLNPLIILFSFGIIGSIFGFIGKAIGSIFSGGSGGKSSSSTVKVDYAKQIRDLKDSFAEQLSEQQEASRKNMLLIGLGAGALIFILVIFMVVGKK